MEPQIFLPKSSPFINVRKWIVYAFLLAGLFMVLRTHSPEFIGLAIIGAVALLTAAFIIKYPVSIVVSTPKRELYYTYINCLGARRTIVVDLTRASGYYEYETVGKGKGSWHLLLYNGSYFRNRVSVEQQEKSGFSKVQLDQIVKLVHQCKR